MLTVVVCCPSVVVVSIVVVVVSIIVVVVSVVIFKSFVSVVNSAALGDLNNKCLLFDQMRVGIWKKGSAAGFLSSSWLLGGSGATL